MSYGAAMALQEAVYGVLVADAEVANLSAGAIYDAIPPGAVPALYVSLGAERVRERCDKTGRGAVHDLSVLVVSDGAGFGAAKGLAVAVADALDGTPMSLARGTLVSVQFRRAEARRSGDSRQIELWFRARVDLSEA